VVDDHRTLAWIVSPMVPGMSAELVELATDPGDQQRRIVPIARPTT